MEWVLFFSSPQSGRASNADFRSSEPLNLALSALPWLPDLRRTRGFACRAISIGRSGRPNHGSAGAVVRAGDADELQKKMGKFAPKLRPNFAK